MSLIALVAYATAATAVPVHTVQMDHRGDSYRVAYRAHVETGSRTIGIAPPNRPSTQRCIITASIAVERVISGMQGSHALTTMLPGKERFTRHLPGSCRSADEETEKLVAQKAGAIESHVAQVAAADRHDALAAIDAAHHFAAN